MARIVTFLIFGGFGLVMLYVGVTQFIQQRRNLAGAQPVMATITYSQVFVGTSADTDPRLDRNTSTTSYRPDVKFSYQLAGQSYESDLLHATDIVRGYASRESAAEVLAPFPVGAQVQAWVNPAQPAKGFLVAEKSAAPMVFIVIGLLLPPLAWWVGKFV